MRTGILRPALLVVWGSGASLKMKLEKQHVWEMSIPDDFVSCFRCSGSVTFSLRMHECSPGVWAKNPGRVEKEDHGVSFWSLQLVEKHSVRVWTVLELNLWQFPHHLLETEKSLLFGRLGSYPTLSCIVFLSVNISVNIYLWNSKTFNKEINYFSWKSVCS